MKTSLISFAAVALLGVFAADCGEAQAAPKGSAGSVDGRSPARSSQARGGDFHGSTQGDLRIYFVDVEGGQATLFVMPQGNSLLVDTGWDGHGGRDAGRIASVAHEAGLKRIDDVLITHFHEDHVGGVPQLADRIPIGRFLDHGELYEHDGGIVERMYGVYRKELAKRGIPRTALKPGERLPVRGLDATVVSSDGEVIAQPLAGAGQANPMCGKEPAPPEDRTENGHSLGFVARFAGVRILDLGDLTKDREMVLACPVNRVGRVDIDIVSHHGWEQSSSMAFVHAIRPRVAVMDNGAEKGGSTPVLDVFRRSPGLETLWQLHTSEEGAKAGGQHNTDAAYIANTPGVEGKPLLLTVHPDGSFAVRNGRTGKTVQYGARRSR